MNQRTSNATTVGIGGRAEQAAAEYLVNLGYQLVEMNYRRKHCEIDVIVRRHQTIYFVEVKYRATDQNGTGMEYIDGRKLQRMTRAAETWVAERRWNGEYTLAAIEVGGSEYEVLDFIESIY